MNVKRHKKGEQNLKNVCFLVKRKWRKLREGDPTANNSDSIQICHAQGQVIQTKCQRRSCQPLLRTPFPFPNFDVEIDKGRG